MNIVGEYVNHNKFGKGIVKLVNDDKIEVEFELGRKKFIYPDVFKSFMSIEDKICKLYLDEVLHEIDKESIEKYQEEVREMELLERVRTLKVSNNSQAAFGFIENNMENFSSTGSVLTGTYISGASKGEPRVPQRLNVNSACLLTMKPDGLAEEERRITGVFMVTDNFKASVCSDGIIKAHEKYRIMLDIENEKLLFWDYSESKSRNKNWGKCELKYFSNTEMQKILLDMTKIIKDEERREIALEFYEYFCYLNKIVI